MTPGEKYSVKIPDEDIEGFKETFRMFDKVPGMGQSSPLNVKYYIVADKLA